MEKHEILCSYVVIWSCNLRCQMSQYLGIKIRTMEVADTIEARHGNRYHRITNA